jgi:hypothetical protein
VTESLKEQPPCRIISSVQDNPSQEETVMAFRNEGTVDRALRVIVGAAVISLVFVGPQTAWGWVGLVPLVTGLVGNCPIYSLLGISTCSLKQQ